MNKNFPSTAKVNLGFSTFSDSKVLIKSSDVYDGMSAGTYFPSPPTPLTDFLASINAYQASRLEATSRDRQAIILKNQNKRALIATLIGLGSYVNLIAGGDVDILQSSGFEVRKSNSPSAPLQAPQNIKATDGVNTGEIVTTVDAVKGADTYIHEYMAMPVTADSVWTITNCTRRRCTLKGLTKKTEYLFRVGAIGVRGQVTYSDTTSRVAQ